MGHALKSLESQIYKQYLNSWVVEYWTDNLQKSMIPILSNLGTYAKPPLLELSIWIGKPHSVSNSGLSIWFSIHLRGVANLYFVKTPQTPNEIRGTLEFRGRHNFFYIYPMFIRWKTSKVSKYKQVLINNQIKFGWYFAGSSWHIPHSHWSHLFRKYCWNDTESGFLLLDVLMISLSHCRWETSLFWSAL